MELNRWLVRASMDLDIPEQALDVYLPMEVGTNTLENSRRWAKAPGSARTSTQEKLFVVVFIDEGQHGTVKSLRCRYVGMR